MFDVTFFSALLGGILTFFAPCTLPLIPGYIAFIGGGVATREERRTTIENAIFFVVGFSSIFILFGVVSGTIGHVLILYRSTIASIGGIFVILLGLSMLDVLSFPQFSAIGFGKVFKRVESGTRIGALLLGILFALGWTPCLGPILGTIIFLAGSGGTALYGGFLLTTYSLGLALPFLIIAFFYGSTFSYVPKLVKYLPWLKKIGGVMIIAIGFLLVIGQFGILNTWASALLGADRFDAMIEYM